MIHSSLPTVSFMKLCRRKPVSDISAILLVNQVSPGRRTLTLITTSRRSASRPLRSNSVSRSAPMVHIHPFPFSIAQEGKGNVKRETDGHKKGAAEAAPGLWSD